MSTRPRSSRGAAVVDFVLVLGLLMPLVLAVLQLALVLFVRNTIASAASEGARYAATADHAPPDGIARTRAQLSGIVSARFVRDVRARTARIAGAPVVEISVRADVPALGLGGAAVSVEMTGRAVQERP